MAEEIVYTTGGAVQADGGFYVPRRADARLLELCQAGVFAFVLTPRQMGKTSLIVRTAEMLNERGTRSVIIDLSSIGIELTAEVWYLSILDIIAEQLALDTDVQSWWRKHSHLSVTRRLTQFIEQVLTKDVEEPLVIFIDEIDTTLGLPFTDDFFAAIRYFYNARSFTPVLKRVSFVLIGVATPTDLIRDPQRTPFNIGERVDLTDFTFDEALPLADGMGVQLSEQREVLRAVMNWTRGHPYLTQRLCKAIKDVNKESWSQSDIENIVAKDFFNAMSTQDNNLQFVADMLLKRAPNVTDVLIAYQEILSNRVQDDEQSPIKSHLKLSGVVRSENNLLQVRNPIYKEVFNNLWVNEHMPSTSVKRLSRYRTRIKRATIAWVAALLVVFSFTAYAATRAIEAEKKRQQAEDQVEALSRERAQINQQLKDALSQSSAAQELEIYAKQQTEAALYAASKARLEVADAQQRLKYAEQERNQAIRDMQAARIMAKNAKEQEQQAINIREQAVKTAANIKQQSDMAFMTVQAHQDAEAYIYKGEHNEALNKFQTILNYYKANEDSSGEASTFISIAERYKALGNTENAVQSYKNAVDLYSKENDQARLAATYTSWGDLYKSGYNPIKALEAYESALKIYEAGNDCSGQFSTLVKIGDQNKSLKHQQEATRYYEQALNKCGVKVRSAVKITLLEKIADFYSSGDNKEEAAKYYNQLLDIYKDNKNDRDQLSTLDALAALYRGSNDKKALDYYQQQNIIYRTTNDRDGQIKTLSNIWYVLKNLQKSEAGKYLNQIFVDICKQPKDCTDQASTLRFIASSLKGPELHEEALRFYELVYRIYESNYDVIEQIKALRNIAGVHRETNDLKGELNAYERMLELYREENLVSAQIQTLITIGDIHKQLGNKKMASKYYDDAKRIEKTLDKD
jgi:tetratricopeptide (TPR) repeat protein